MSTKTKKPAITPTALKALTAFVSSAHLYIMGKVAMIVNGTTGTVTRLSDKTFEILLAQDWISHPVAITQELAECQLTERGSELAARLRSSVDGFYQLSFDMLDEEAEEEAAPQGTPAIAATEHSQEDAAQTSEEPRDQEHPEAAPTSQSQTANRAETLATIDSQLTPSTTQDRAASNDQLTLPTSPAYQLASMAQTRPDRDHRHSQSHRPVTAIIASVTYSDHAQPQSITTATRPPVTTGCDPPGGPRDFTISTEEPRPRPLVS